MKRRILTLALILTLTLPLAALAAPAERFSGVLENAADIGALAERGLMGGVGDGKFAPDLPMTRAMLSAVLFRLAGAERGDYAESPLTDVDMKSWYGPAAQWAWQAGLIVCKDGLFRPDEALTYAEAASVLRRYAGGFETVITGGGNETLTRASAATLLRRFADTSPAAPLTLRDVEGTNCGEENLFRENDAYSFTQTGYNADWELVTDRYTATRSKNGLQFVALLSNGDTYLYRPDGLYNRDKDGSLSLAVMAGEHTADVLRDAGNDILFAYDANAYITGLVRGQGILTVHTEVAGLESGRLTYDYTLDEKTLVLSKRVGTSYNSAGEMDGQQTLTVLYGAATQTADFAFSPDAAADGRTCTVIMDPGTETERTFTYKTAEGWYFGLYGVPGYDYYEDPRGTKLLEGSGASKGDITVYLLPHVEKE